ncbi:MAG: hypothetical protein JSV62_13195 [Promethearchaeota archaeon]|nr:MAG: hypothetical protein JSV62_13195 [Candidatus Lokiarchaeota archaeon]
MTATEEKIIPILKEFPKYKILNEIEKEIKKEVKIVTVLENNPDPIQKRRDNKKWKETMGFYSLNPNKFRFGLKDLK